MTLQEMTFTFNDYPKTLKPLFLTSWMDLFITASFPLRYALNILQTGFPQCPGYTGPLQKEKNFPSYSTITVTRDLSQFRNMKWIFLFLQPLHSASYAWGPTPSATLEIPHPHSKPRLILAWTQGSLKTRNCLPWHLSWITRNMTSSWKLDSGNAFNPTVTILFTSRTSEESGKANKSSKLVDRWDI